MGMLDGIRILELGRVAPAELPGMMFGDLGAEVVKVETPSSHTSTTDSIFAPTNRNKQSISINLKVAEGRSIFMRLAEAADVIVEGFRPGVVDRLGVGYESVRAVNPRVIFCSMSSFGQTGPYSQRSAHDLNFLGLSGALNLIGEPGRRPAVPINMVADLGGASMHAAFAIAAALFGRERNGRGQYIDLSYLDSAIALLAPTTAMRSYFSSGIAIERGEGVCSGAYAYYAIYETSEGRMITLACSEPPLWEKFCNIVGRPDLVPFARKREHYDRGPDAAEIAAKIEVEKLIRTRTQDEWVECLAPAGVCIGKMLTVKEMMADPQVSDRSMIVELNHPRIGAIKQIGPAIKFSNDAACARSPAPVSGENTLEILRGLGFSEKDIEELAARGVVEQANYDRTTVASD